MIDQRGHGTLVDLGSTNGTFLGGSSETVERGVPVPVTDGTTVHLGAWTAVTLPRGHD